MEKNDNRKGKGILRWLAVMMAVFVAATTVFTFSSNNSYGAGHTGSSAYIYPMTSDLPSRPGANDGWPSDHIYMNGDLAYCISGRASTNPEESGDSGYSKDIDVITKNNLSNVNEYLDDEINLTEDNLMLLKKVLYFGYHGEGTATELKNWAQQKDWSGDSINDMNAFLYQSTQLVIWNLLAGGTLGGQSYGPQRGGEYLKSFAQNNDLPDGVDVDISIYHKDGQPKKVGGGKQNIITYEIKTATNPTITNTTASAKNLTATGTDNDGAKVYSIKSGDSVTITDTIDYKDLKEGTKYIIVSDLYTEGSVKETKETEVSGGSSTNVEFTPVTPADNQVYNIATKIYEGTDMSGEPVAQHNQDRKNPSERVSFTHITPAKIKLVASKSIGGSGDNKPTLDDIKDVYTFTLTGDGITGSGLTAKNAADGTVTFGEIELSEANTYNYTIKETDGSFANITNTTEQRNVKVTTAVQNGKLVVTDAVMGNGTKLTWSENGGVTTATLPADRAFVNTYNPPTPPTPSSDKGKVTIKKFDEKGAPLSEAKLQIVNSAKEVVKDNITTTGEPIVFEDLPVGSYVLRETAAPDYYKTAADVPFKVAVDSGTTFTATTTTTADSPVKGHYAIVLNDGKGNKYLALCIEANATAPLNDVQYAGTYVDENYSGIKELYGQDFIEKVRRLIVIYNEDPTNIKAKSNAGENIAGAWYAAAQGALHRLMGSDSQYTHPGDNDPFLGNLETLVGLIETATSDPSIAIPDDTYAAYYISGTSAAQNLVALELFGSVEMVDEPTGKLTISKKINGEGDTNNPDQTFKFTVTGLPEGETYSYTQDNESKTIDNNGTVTLKGGESVTITGLPANTNYTVTEGSVPNWTPTPEGREISGTIVAKQTQTAAFTNTYTPGEIKAGIQLEKSITNYPEGQTYPSFKFNLTTTSTEGVEIENGIRTRWTNADSHMLNNPFKVKFTAAGDYTFTIAEDDSNKTESRYTNVEFNTTPKTVTFHVSRDDATGELKIDSVDGATKDGNNWKVTESFKNDYPTVEVKATKKWVGTDGKTATAPSDASVTFTLKADDPNVTIQNATQTIKNGTITWSNLTKYKADGTKVNYTVEESAFEGTGFTKGTVSEDEDSTDNFAYTVTNNESVETIKVAGSKTWDDADNQDGKRPGSITIRLLADGVEKDSKTVTAADNWSWEFTNLAKKANGKDIVYTIEEDVVKDYTSTVSGYNVTNTYTPGKTQVKVTKKWDDKSNQDGKRPASVTVHLLADGEQVETKVLNAANKWTHTFTDLDEKKDGNEIKYTVTEEPVKDYKAPAISGDAKTGFTITNSYTPETTTVAGSKTWDDADNQDGKRPGSITIRLLADGVEKDSKTVTAADNWSWKFENLAKKAKGKDIVYTIEEDTVEDYTSTVSGYDVTNSYTPGKTQVKVTKKWDDADDQDKKRPASVTVHLLADGEQIETKVLNAANKWTHTFTGLDEKKDGKAIKYTVTEEAVDGYKDPVISGTAKRGFTITNSYTPETSTVEISKVDATDATKELPGAELIIKDSTGKIIDNWISKETVHKVHLEEGTYTLTEITAPDGYKKAESITFDVDAEGKVASGKVVMVDEPTKVTFSKQDLGGNELPGATIQVLDSNGKVVEEWTSTTKPHVIEKLEAGSYTMHEVAAPAGYCVVTTDIPFAIDSDGNVNVTDDTVVMTDAPTTVTISKKAVNGTDELPGAQLTITDASGNIAKSVITNEELSWTSASSPKTIEGLAPGSYTLTEIAAPDEYNKAESIKFTIAADGTVTSEAAEGKVITMKDAPFTEVTFTKSDLGGDEVTGAKIQILKDNDEKTIVDEWISEKGPHKIKLEDGKYIMHEETAPKGFFVATDIPFTVKSGDAKATTSVDMKDKAWATVKISKVDATDATKELPGANLTIKDADGKEVESWTSTDKVHEVKLKPGTYTLTEVTAPKGYQKAETITFTVGEDGLIEGDKVQMQDKPNPTVEISKTDAATSEELPGAKLEVRKADRNKTLVDSWESTSESHKVQLAPGKYTLTEITAPQGYNVAETIEFEVGADGLVKGDKVEMKDAPYVEVSFTKKELGGDEIEGATITVYKANEDGTLGEKVETWVSTTEPYKIKLADGDYVMHEEVAPHGYYVATDIPFTVRSGDATATTSVNMDDKRWGEVTISKTDAVTSEELPGATLIIKKGDEEIAAWVSGDEPHKIRLEEGTYTLTEITAPDGYNVAETITFKVDKDGLVDGDKVEMKDAPYTEVTFSKQDLGGKEIGGAAIQILENGEVIDQWISEEGKSHMIGLPAGTYTMHEDAAPAGYEVATDITFTVNNDGTVTVGETTVDGNVVKMTDKAEHGPAIEKYVNYNVHADLQFEEGFAYDIMAYVPVDATHIEITDELNDQLEYADRETGRANATTDFNTAVSGVFYRSENNHKAEGSVWDAPDGEVKYTGSIVDNKLTVIISDIGKGEGLQDLGGKWVQVHIYAKVAKAACEAAEKQDYTAIEAAKVDIADNTPVIPNPEQATHNGIPNKAAYTVFAGNDGDKTYGTTESNTVTVRPLTYKAYMKKVWKDAAGAEIKWPEDESVSVNVIREDDLAQESAVIETVTFNDTGVVSSKEYPFIYATMMSVEELDIPGYTKEDITGTGSEDDPFVFTNKKEKEKPFVEISKQDFTTGNELPGATLVIKDKDGNTVNDAEGKPLTWVSGTEAHKVQLAPGTYTLTETAPPDGYLQYEETVEFTVDENGLVGSERVVMYNSSEKVMDRFSIGIILEKEWKDANGAKADWPENTSVEFTLEYYNNVDNTWKTYMENDGPVKVTLDAAHTSYTFEELPAMINGETARYRAVETAIEGWKAEALDETHLDAEIPDGRIDMVNVPDGEQKEDVTPVIRTVVTVDGKAASSAAPAEVTLNAKTGKVHVTDTISYTGMTPNAVYTVTGDLMKIVDGKEPESVANVKAEYRASETGTGTWLVDFGEVTVEENTKYVVFETAVNKNDETQKAEHKDVNDNAQTVIVKPFTEKEKDKPTPGGDKKEDTPDVPSNKDNRKDTPGSSTKKNVTPVTSSARKVVSGGNTGGSVTRASSTGDSNNVTLWIVAAAAAAAAMAGVAFAMRRRRRNDQ